MYHNYIIAVGLHFLILYPGLNIKHHTYPCFRRLLGLSLRLFDYLILWEENIINMLLMLLTYVDICLVF